MKEAIVIRLAGASAAGCAEVLVARLKELGASAEFLDEAAITRIGGANAAAQACERLARDGVFAVTTARLLAQAMECLDVEISPHDTPDFAAEKVLDQLASHGLVRLDLGEYSQAEEEEIRKRLSGLGYIE